MRRAACGGAPARAEGVTGRCVGYGAAWLHQVQDVDVGRAVGNDNGAGDGVVARDHAGGGVAARLGDCDGVFPPAAHGYPPEPEQLG
jgi:hypothetical protein